MHSRRVHPSQPKEFRTRETQNPPERQDPSHPADEVKLGIDFWHAVEFSRSGRTPTSSLSATRRGNRSSLGQLLRPGQIAVDLTRMDLAAPATDLCDPSGA